MIFKIYESDLDGITNKLGFSKRTFAEWGSQVKQSFKEAEVGSNKFHTRIKQLSSATKTALFAPKDGVDWIKTLGGEIVDKDNIDSFIPKLNNDIANNMAKEIFAIDKAGISWDAYFSKLKKGNQEYIIDFIKNNKNLSKVTGEDLVKANKNARQAVIAHNAANRLWEQKLLQLE